MNWTLAETTEHWTGRWQKRPNAGEKQPDALIKRLDKQASVAATGRWRQIDRTQDSRVRSSTERFHSGENTTRRVRWHVTGRWQRPISGSRLQRSGRPDTSDQDDLSLWSVAEKRDFVPNGYFLSGAYKYNPQPAK